MEYTETGEVWRDRDKKLEALTRKLGFVEDNSLATLRDRAIYDLILDKSSVENLIKYIDLSQAEIDKEEDPTESLKKQIGLIVSQARIYHLANIPEESTQAIGDAILYAENLQYSGEAGYEQIIEDLEYLGGPGRD